MADNPQDVLPGLRDLAQTRQFQLLKTRALALGTADPAVCALLAFAHAALGEADAARTLLEGDATSPLDGPAQADRAGAWILLGQLDTAQALLQAALAQDPDCAMACARLAYLHELRGELAQAEAHYTRAWALDPGRLSVGLNHAALLRANGKPDLAQSVIDACRRLVPLAEPGGLAEAFRQVVIDQLDATQLAVWIDAGQLAQAERWVEELPDAGGEGSVRHAWTLRLASLLAQQDRVADSEALLRDALARHPESIALMRRLAELAQLHGNTALALRWTRRALHQAPDDVALWAELSCLCLPEYLEAARAAAERALALAATQGEQAQLAGAVEATARARAALAHARLARARVAAESQAYDEAQALFEAVLDVFPHHVAALQSLGHMQLQQGRIDEALLRFEQVRRLDPVSGLSAQIHARHVPQDPETIARLEAAARRPGLHRSVGGSLLFQVAAAWDKHGQYARAFACARDANEARRRTLRYDPQAHRDHCARVRARFDADFMRRAAATGLGLPDTLPVFVVGMPRSGTTLVEQILAGHSEVFGAGELGTLPQLIAGLQRWERQVGSGRGYPDCVDDLTPEVAAGIARPVLADLQAMAAQARHVVDKLPHNFESVGLIKLLFPRAKIISVRREPRDIAISNYFADYQALHGGMGFAYDLGWIGEQLADHELLMQHWHHVFPGEILEVQYEALVQDPPGQARRMLDYLGLPWQEQVLDTAGLDRPIRTASVAQVRQPIYQTSRARWEHYREFLAPLEAAMHAPVEPRPVTGLVTLPQPGLLSQGIAQFKAGQLEAAQAHFDQLLAFLPDHAAACFMSGLVHACRGQLAEGIAQMEKAHRQVPGNARWGRDLARAYALAGRGEEALALAGTLERQVQAQVKVRRGAEGAPSPPAAGPNEGAQDRRLAGAGDPFGIGMDIDPADDDIPWLAAGDRG